MLESIINYTLSFIMWLVIGRALISFFTTSRENFIFNFFYTFTEPLYKLIDPIVKSGKTLVLIIIILLLRVLTVKLL